jgi:transposase
MLTSGEDMEISALRKRGWSISAIARHVGRDRKTVRSYLAGDRTPGVRARAGEDCFDRFEPYVRQRLSDDPHVWATVLFDEIVKLGFARSYQTFTRQIRIRGLRPHCEPCSASNGRAHVDIEHSPGEEIQWDWLEFHQTPWGAPAYVLVGSLSYSGRFRAWLSESMDQAHLVVGIDEVLRRLGGTARDWRVDRMATVIRPGTNEVQRSFVPVAKHYGVNVVPCPPRHGNRKGVVEKNNDFITQRWWRTAAVATIADAQASLDRFCVTVGDARPRIAPTDENDGRSAAPSGDVHSPHRTEERPVRVTVGDLADAEPLLALPERPYPAEVVEVRTVAANALVSLWGNRYSVPPGLVGTRVQARWRLGTTTVSVHAGGREVATHTLAPRGAQRTVRLAEHTAALTNVVLGAFNSAKPCDRKLNRPPSAAALALAAELAGESVTGPVIDLAVYEQVAQEGGR